MRLIVACLFLLALAGAAGAAGPGPRPASSTNVLRLHPHAWQMPAPATAAGIRFEPETGAPAEELPAPAAQRSLRSAPVVRVAADGSRHAVIGGAIRYYTIATIDDQGRLVQDCVHSEQQAEARVAAGSKRVPR